MAIAPLHLRRALAAAALVAFAVLSHASPPANEAEAAELRRKVKEGRLDRCVTDTVFSPAPDPVLVFQNHCDMLVNVTLCVKPDGEEKAYYMLLLRPQSQARHRLWMQSATFEYKYNSCEKSHCSAPEPEC
jgi:hypothetical protein